MIFISFSSRRISNSTSCSGDRKCSIIYGISCNCLTENPSNLTIISPTWKSLLDAAVPSIISLIKYPDSTDGGNQMFDPYYLQ